jgi:hypothetical protein
MWLVFYKNEESPIQVHVRRKLLLSWILSFSGRRSEYSHCEVLLENKTARGKTIYEAYGISSEINNGVGYKQVRSSQEIKEKRGIAYKVLNTSADSLNKKTTTTMMYDLTRSWYDRNTGRFYKPSGLSNFMYCFLCYDRKDCDTMHTAEFASHCLNKTQKLGGLASRLPFNPERYTIDSLLKEVQEKDAHPPYAVEDTEQLFARME